MNLYSKPINDPIMAGLIDLLTKHVDKRIAVLGTTCTGKSTMLAHIPGARDQDKEVFPKLTQAEADYVCQVPWTEEIGRTMSKFVRERVISEAGRPVFGTVVIDCDLIILLKISDELLSSRVALRKVQFTDAKNMQAKIIQDVIASAIPYVEYSVG